MKVHITPPIIDPISRAAMYGVDGDATAYTRGLALVQLDPDYNGWTVMRNSSPAGQRIRVGPQFGGVGGPSFGPVIKGMLLEPGDVWTIPAQAGAIYAIADAAGAVLDFVKLSYQY